MKKLIAILTVMIILVGAVFATSGDELLVNAKVSKTPPAFSLYGGLATTSYQKANATIETQVDISEDPAVVFVKVVQNNKSKYKGSFNLMIAATSMTDGTVTSSVTPVSSDISKATGISDLTIGTVAGDGTASVTIPLTYTGKKVGSDEAETQIASFKYTWAADDTLPPAETGNADRVYHATITLTYNVN